MELKIHGKIVQIMDARTGSSQRGPWKSQEFLLETIENYPRKVVFNVFGEDRLTKFGLKVDAECDVYFDISARESNGRWFNSINAYDVRMSGVVPAVPVTVHNADGTTETQGLPFPGGNEGLGF